MPVLSGFHGGCGTPDSKLASSGENCRYTFRENLCCELLTTGWRWTAAGAGRKGVSLVGHPVSERLYGCAGFVGPAVMLSNGVVVDAATLPAESRVLQPVEVSQAALTAITASGGSLAGHPLTLSGGSILDSSNSAQFEDARDRTAPSADQPEAPIYYHPVHITGDLLSQSGFVPGTSTTPFASLPPSCFAEYSASCQRKQGLPYPHPQHQHGLPIICARFGIIPTSMHHEHEVLRWHVPVQL